MVSLTFLLTADLSVGRLAKWSKAARTLQLSTTLLCTELKLFFMIFSANTVRSFTSYLY